MNTKETWKYLNVLDFRSFGSKMKVWVIQIFCNRRTQNRSNYHGRQGYAKHTKDTLKTSSLHFETAPNAQYWAINISGKWGQYNQTVDKRLINDKRLLEQLFGLTLSVYTLPTVIRIWWKSGVALHSQISFVSSSLTATTNCTTRKG